MLTKEQFLASAATEIKICKHLYSKLTPEQLAYSPGEGMRSTLDTLRYLTYCGVVPASAVLRGDWEIAGKTAAATADMSAEEFPQRMDRQLQELTDLLGAVDDDELQSREVVLPWGATGLLGPVLVDTSLKFLTAYRMQLFLLAKASGSNALNTMNCWLGMDPPSKG